MSGFDIEMRSKINSSIGSIDAGSISESKKNSSKESGGNSVSFGDLLGNYLEEVNQANIQADKAAEELTAGRTKDIHGTMLNIEKADLSFRLLTQVRNKMLEAYKEIMRMQV